MGLAFGETVVNLAPYEVAAWHFDGLAMEVPASVVRLERAEIESSGTGSVPELLERMAGIRFRGFTATGAEGQLAMRGFGDNSGLRVLVLVDGQPYNPPDMGGINWLGLEVEELETVEVLRGGQTVLYGNHAVSGVVKLQTRNPGEETEGRLNGELGSDGLHRVGASVGQKFGKVGIRAGGSWIESDGYRDNSQMEGKTAYFGWRYDDAGNNIWSGRFTIDETLTYFPGPLTFEQLQDDPRQSNNSGFDRSKSNEWQATVNGEGETSWGNWQLNGGLLERDRKSDLEGIHADNLQERATISPRLRLQGESGFVIGGTDLAWDQVDYRGYLGADRIIERAFADIDRLTAGGYIFGSQNLSETITLSGGLRIESARTENFYVQYEENQLRPVLETNRGPVPNPDFKDPPDPDPDQSFSGRVDKSGWAGEVSILYKASDGFHFWGGWDRVYRYPSLDETAAYQGFPLSDPLNENLDPETGHNFELGIKRFEVNWNLGLTLFLLRMNDEIAFQEDLEFNQRLNVNIGDTERRGLELDASYQKDRYGFNLHGSIIWAEFRDKNDGDKLPLVPEIEGSLTAWVSPARTLRFQVHLRYLSSQFQGNDFDNIYRKIPAYGLVDLNLEWKPVDGIVLTGGINNLLDEVHAVAAYSGGFYPGSGRQGYIRMKVNF